MLQEKVLGNAIRDSRIRLGITQEDLSEMVGITPTHLKHIESEHRKPSIEVLFKLVQILNISLDSLLLEQPDRSSFSETECTINALLKTCSDGEKNIVLDLIKSIQKNRFSN